MRAREPLSLPESSAACDEARKITSIHRKETTAQRNKALFHPADVVFMYLTPTIIKPGCNASLSF